MMVTLMIEVYVHIIQKVDVEIEFPQYPSATISQLAMMIDQDMISEENGVKMILQQVGVPLDMHLEGENSHKRPRLNGNKESIKEYMDLVIKDMKSDIKTKEQGIKESEVGMKKTDADTKKVKAEAEAIKRGDGEGDGPPG
jgi:hypothetical protein